METTMGRVTTEATVENLKDIWDVERGMIPPEHARKLIVPDAIVDSGATLLSLPTRLIQQLGVEKTGTRNVTSSAGPREAAMYEAVRLTIQGRWCTVDVMEVPNSVPTLIGQIPLEHLDLVINPSSRTLTGNPAHDGELVYEMY
jgi:predicted aspartyl protease